MCSILKMGVLGDKVIFIVLKRVFFMEFLLESEHVLLLFQNTLVVSSTKKHS